MSWVQYGLNIYGAVLLVLIVSALALVAACLMAVLGLLLLPVGIMASPFLPHYMGVSTWPGMKWRKRAGPGMRNMPRGVPTDDIGGTRNGQ